MGPVDEDHLHGRWIGYDPETGLPGWQETPYPDSASESVDMKKSAHVGNSFNLKRCEALPLNRPVNETRSPKCQEKAWPIQESWPATSVIFIFYNEPLCSLFRSIHSILNRSPPRLLHEIVLVDDGSPGKWLGEPLESYMRLLPAKVKLVRLPKRSGLMVAKTRGAMEASGETLTFLDSHVEAQKGWLEPLMSRISEDPKRVVMPVIDFIDADHFGMTGHGIDVLGFDWGLGHAGFTRVWDKMDTLPVASPIMAGGLFSIRRDAFFALGGYDLEMRQWGGEEFDISFRIWLCGYTLECHPCSHVGHIFRSGAYWQGGAYPVDPSNVVVNKMRVAEVWMDEYKSVVGKSLVPNRDLGSLELMRKVKEELKCKPFRWYVEHVYPELFDPLSSRQVWMKGGFANKQLGGLLALPHAKDGTEITWRANNGGTPASDAQLWIVTTMNEIRSVSGLFSYCMDTGNQPNGELVVWKCHNGGGNQRISFNPQTGAITDLGNRCLSLIDSKPRFTACHPNSPDQQWQLQ